MTVMVEMNSEELRRRIPYALICETRYGAKWDTYTRKRKWVEVTSEADRRRLARLFKKAHEWTLTRGVPETYLMKPSEICDWDFLASFCLNL